MFGEEEEDLEPLWYRKWEPEKELSQEMKDLVETFRQKRAREVQERLLAALELKDVVARLASLEEIRLEIYNSEDYWMTRIQSYFNDPRVSEGDGEGILSRLIRETRKEIRNRKKNNDWLKKSQLQPSEAGRLLQEARSFLWSENRFWEKEYDQPSGSQWKIRHFSKKHLEQVAKENSKLVQIQQTTVIKEVTTPAKTTKTTTTKTTIIAGKGWKDI